MTHYPTPESFYESTPPRASGTENEYQIGLPPHSHIRQQDLLENLGVRCVSRGVHDRNDVFTEYGARVYNDLMHTEFASAETLGPHSTALAEHGGTFIVAQMGRALRLLHDRPADLSSDSLYPQRRSATYYPNSTDHGKIKTKGYHQNFQMPAEFLMNNWSIFEPVMSSFLAIKPLISGGGFVTDHYAVSQKMSGIGSRVTRKTCARLTSHGDKPLATALYAHNDSLEKTQKDWAIFETRSSDPLMHPHMSELDIASVSLCLRLLERSLITKQNSNEFSLADPVFAAQSMAMSLETTLSGDHLTVDGRTIRLPQLLGKFAALFTELVADNPDLPPDEKAAAIEWFALADQIASLSPAKPDTEHLAGSIEWAAKRQFIEQNTKKTRQDDMFRHIALDLLWTNMGQERAFGRAYLQKHSPSYQYYQAEIADYAKQAPTDTRACVRAELIKSGLAQRAGWSTVDITADNEFGYETIDISNVYDTKLH